MLLLAALLACSSPAPAPEPEPEPPAAAPTRTEAVIKPAEREARWADARCNDGSPFAYTMRQGDPKLWVINLSGGFSCEDDRALCSERRPRLTTTLPEADGSAVRFRSRGVFNPDPSQNPTFAGATHVDAHYCSSDMWIGGSTERQPTTGDPERGWFFSGRRNLEVLLESLEVLHGLDLKGDQRLLLIGTSAGGLGLMGNIEAVTQRYPEAVAEHRVKLVIDGAWIPTQPPQTPLPDIDRWGPILPPCDAALRARGEDPVRCLFGPNWWPYVQQTGVDLLVQVSAVDTTQTPTFGANTAQDRAAWALHTRESLAPLPWVFSGGKPYHVVTVEGLFSKGPPGRSFREVLDRFWAGGAPEQVFFGYPPTP